MIAAKDDLPKLTSEEYFVWEEQQLDKYEYIDGQVCVRDSRSVNHSCIAVRLIALIDTHLANTGCITGNSDLKVNILETANYTYPDVSVTCDERDKNATQYIAYPCLIIEVLSDSTEAYDRGGKFRQYRRNPALKDYLLVSSTRIEMDLSHKNEAGDWLIFNYQLGDTIELNSINFSFPIEQVYRDLTLTSDA